jgi:hypothetical protein
VSFSLSNCSAMSVAVCYGILVELLPPKATPMRHVVGCPRRVGFPCLLTIGGSSLARLFYLSNTDGPDLHLC